MAKINVLIVDDSIIYRKSISDIVSLFDQCEIVHTAPNAEIALNKLKSTPYSFILTDINMPGLNGYELQSRIKEINPSISVILMSSENYSQTSLTIEALNNGAIDFIQKPTSSSHQSNLVELDKQIFTLFKTLFPTITRRGATISATPTNRFQPKRSTPPAHTKNISAFSDYKLLVIGVSTGGPQALGKIIPKLPSTFKIPILIVQHMPANFTRSLADSLDKKSFITVKEAEQNDSLTPGIAYIAPGGKQMAIHSNQGKPIIVITDDPPENSCKPSVDYTFRSVATEFKSDPILSIILTGMGSDGYLGVERLKTNSSYCITQSEKSCVVYGMPKAVDETGLSDLSVDIDLIASKIIELVR